MMTTEEKVQLENLLFKLKNNIVEEYHDEGYTDYEEIKEANLEDDGILTAIDVVLSAKW